MKIIASRLFLIGLVLASFISSAQKINLFTENFDKNTCVSSSDTCYADGYNGWTVTQPTTNGAYPNRWFVSTNENGGGSPGTCGQRSNTSSNGSLHIGSTRDQYGYIANNYPTFAQFFPCTNGDCGDTYCAGLGLDGSFVTDQRIESPLINFKNTGCSVFLTFNYIEYGDGTNDNMTVEYSPDNGATWLLLVDPAKTDTCPTALSGDGIWTKLSVELPDTLFSQPYKYLKIGFRWVNNDDGMGHDPAAAIDSVNVYTTNAPDITNVPLPTQCAPANIVFQPTYADPNYDYIWTIPNENGIGSQTFSDPNALDSLIRTYPNGTTGNGLSFSLTVSSAYCGQTGNTDYLVIKNCAQPTAAFSPGDTTICNSQCINFINKSFAAGKSTYAWNFGTAANPYTTSSTTATNPPQVCFSQPGSYPITLMVTDVNGNTASVTHTITVNVCNGPVASFTFLPKNPCTGAPVTITNTSIHDSICTWTFNGGTPPTYVGKTPPTVSWATKGTYEIVLVVDDGKGDPTVSDSAQITVDSCGKVNANFTAKTSLCEGSCLQYTNLTTGGQLPYTYEWSFPGGTPSSSSLASPPFVCYQKAGVYDVSLKVTASDPNDVDSITKPGYITVFPLPTATATNTTSSSDTLSIVSGSSVSLSASGGQSYSWYPNTNISSDTVSNPTVTPADTTVYTVTVTDANGCTAQASVYIDVISENVIFAPNLFTPNNDKVNDYFKVFFAGNVIQYELGVFDRWGTEIFFTHDPNIAWDGTYNGKPCGIGVYVWYYKVKFYDGKQFAGKGDVTLLR